MRCVRCKSPLVADGRTMTKCPFCNASFVFRPKDGVSDAVFDAAIRTVSAEGDLRFGKSHLYYELCWRLREGSTVAISERAFDKLLDRWLSARGAIPNLVKEHPRPRETRFDEELATYSFDRAIVTDRRDIAEVLLANHFHFENNCAVLTLDGYPEKSFALVRRMLENNERLVVVAVHDATPEGMQLAPTIAKEWFGKTNAVVIDGGLFETNAAGLEGIWIPRKKSAKGKKFLDRYALELPAIRPNALLRRLFQTVHRNAVWSPLEGADKKRGYRLDDKVFGFRDALGRRLDVQTTFERRPRAIEHDDGW